MSALAGRRALVTGAAQGIGRVIARRFAAEGAEVIAWDIQRDALEAVVSELSEAGGVAHGDVIDITDEQAVAAALAALAGPVDVLVNNAAFERYEPFLEISLKSWRQHIDIDLTAVFICSQAVARGMVAAGVDGRIVHLASINSFGAEPGLAHYAAAKGGIATLTQSMAIELAAHGIRVNAVAPGPIGTEKTLPLYDQPSFQASLARVALGRPGTPEEVAAACLFLASDEASFVTGATLLVDGGYLAGL